MAEFLIYGAGGSAREVAWLASECGQTVRGFVDDDERAAGRIINDLPVLRLNDAAARYSKALVVGAVGSPAVRESVIDKAIASGFELGTLVHPRVETSRWVSIGPGTVICAGCILTTNITIGRSVQINLDCTISHDAVLEDYVTLAPGVHVSGWVRIERRAYIGTGVSIINGTEGDPLIIGAGAIVGAGACVTRSIPAGVTAVGVPAKPRP
jgi:sugar O-acyltransferase (sialic acid O-acetyltransferase NeuD family)